MTDIHRKFNRIACCVCHSKRSHILGLKLEMAVGSRGKARGRGRGRGRTRKKDDSDMPDVYQDMLADAGSSPTRMSEEGRTLKKRRVGGRLVVSGDSKALDEPSISAAPTNDDQGMETDVTKASTVQPTKQTVYDDSEDSEESDMDWQDVRLEAGNEALDSGDEPGDLSLVIGGEKDERTKNESSNRKQITAAERKLRLEIHKMHLLSLSSHVYLRNHWCNDSTVQVCATGGTSIRILRHCRKASLGY